MKEIAIIGTQGVPANYGGFETLVENIISYCSDNIHYTVFCSNDNKLKYKTYKNATLRYINLSANGIQSIFYDSLSLIYSIRKYDTILVLGVSGGLFFPIFRILSHKRLIVNIDGMEWKRGKWGKTTKKYLHSSERMAVKYSDVIIGDNKAIVDYVKEYYNKKAELIAYGGDHVCRNVSEVKENEILKNFNLIKREYNLSICRIEPENNCDLILNAFSKMPNEVLIFIGNWDFSDYSRNLKKKYSYYKNITLLNSIYALDALYVFRTDCKYYIHGHSAGGSNPSLIEAMHCGCNILAYDVVFNKETTHHSAIYFHSEKNLEKIIKDKNRNLVYPNERILHVAQKYYLWSNIAEQYEKLY